MFTSQLEDDSIPNLAVLKKNSQENDDAFHSNDEPKLEAVSPRLKKKSPIASPNNAKNKLSP